MYKPFTEDEIEKIKKKYKKKHPFSEKVEINKKKENNINALNKRYNNKIIYAMLTERKEFNYSYGTFLRILREKKD